MDDGREAAIARLPEIAAMERFQLLRQDQAVRRAKREAAKARKAKRTGKRQSWLTEPATTYFLACQGFVKIGSSRDVAGRMDGIRTGSPHEQVLLLTIEGTRETERQMHGLFHSCRHSGEWFRLEGSLASFIDGERAKNTKCKTMPHCVK